ncbi:MAG TPA: type VI secretion system baseplate subunit TssK [Pyrinomonadaceae bacterium]|jgi:type VI secretion system protein ImpJ
MSRYRKIVWQEGMLLTPHHFQQWDNYYEGLLESRLAALAAYGWGVLELKINEAAVVNGRFELERCRAVMPDGLLLDVPRADPAPSEQSFPEHFAADARHLDVHLAVPVRRDDDANFSRNSAGEGATARYGQSTSPVIDETTGDPQSRRELEFARTNLRLLFGGEPARGYVSIRIARIIRRPSGQFALADGSVAPEASSGAPPGVEPDSGDGSTHVPPALNIAASPWLMGIFRRLVDILTTKSDVESDRKGRGSALADLNTLSPAHFWLLHTVSSALPVLSHLLRTSSTQPVHPERLYVEMTRLAGELMTFAPGAPEYRPKQLARYQHENLFATFDPLDRLLRRLLEIVIPTNLVPIELVQVRSSVFRGSIEDERLLEDADFYLGVHADVDETRLMDDVPEYVKITAPDIIDSFITRAGSALKLLLAPSPPPAPVPNDPGFRFFKLERAGKHWKAIQGAKALAVYMPTKKFPNGQVKLYAVKHEHDG